jgi:hypothetical protein
LLVGGGVPKVTVSLRKSAGAGVLPWSSDLIADPTIDR